jgi:hypothetical protein
MLLSSIIKYIRLPHFLRSAPCDSRPQSHSWSRILSFGDTLVSDPFVQRHSYSAATQVPRDYRSDDTILTATVGQVMSFCHETFSTKRSKRQSSSKAASESRWQDAKSLHRSMFGSISTTPHMPNRCAYAERIWPNMQPYRTLHHYFETKDRQMC